MKIYRVGGSVRDSLLGEPIHDSDWVVVGSTPEQMVAAGFTPVGRDFPVFLHPSTHEEYALARTERKTAAGYRGFVMHASPDVTLEQDLSRRDLTINAMAMSADGDIIDPYGGQADLAARVFRHVSPAFVEDPVRILRVARFAARLGDFHVHPTTATLMRTMVENGEVDSLVPERVWQELSRGLMARHPQRMIEVLHDCKALERVLPGLQWHQRVADNLRCAEAHRLTLPARYAVLVASASIRPSAQSVDLIATRLRVPADCRDCARLLVNEHKALAEATVLAEDELLSLLERIDAFRRQERIAPLIKAFVCTYRPEQAGAGEPSGKTGSHQSGQSQDLQDCRAEQIVAVLQSALSAARSIDARAVAKAAHADGSSAIKQAIFDARVNAIKALSASSDQPGDERRKP